MPLAWRQPTPTAGLQLLPAPNRWSILAATAPGVFSIIPMAVPLPREISYTPVAGCGIKPDVMAADGVKTSANPAAINPDTGLPIFNPFYGTSAAAPHAAAIAALLLSSGANYTQIRHALTSTALPSATWNDYAGYGIIMADRALNALSRPSVSTLMLLLLN